MPKGVYPRKKKTAPTAKVKIGRVHRIVGDDAKQIVAFLRAARTRAEDRVVAFGTALEALEALES